MFSANVDFCLYFGGGLQEELEAVFKEMQKRNLITKKVITPAPARSLARSLTHSLTHSLTQLFDCSPIRIRPQLQLRISFLITLSDQYYYMDAKYGDRSYYCIRPIFTKSTIEQVL